MLHVFWIRLYILVRWTLSFKTLVVTGTRSLACREDSVASWNTFNITTAGYLTLDEIGLTVCLALCYTFHIWAIFIESSPAYAKNLCPSKKFHFEKSLFRFHKKMNDRNHRNIIWTFSRPSYPERKILRNFSELGELKIRSIYTLKLLKKLLKSIFILSLNLHYYRIDQFYTISI